MEWPVRELDAECQHPRAGGTGEHPIRLWHNPFSLGDLSFHQFSHGNPLSGWRGSTSILRIPSGSIRIGQRGKASTTIQQYENNAELQLSPSKLTPGLTARDRRCHQKNRNRYVGCPWQTGTEATLRSASVSKANGGSVGFCCRQRTSQVGFAEKLLGSPNFRFDPV